MTYLIILVSKDKEFKDNYIRYKYTKFDVVASKCQATWYGTKPSALEARKELMGLDKNPEHKFKIIKF